MVMVGPPGIIPGRMVNSPRKKRGTRTSSFGSPAKISHDADRFYASRLYEDLPGEQKVIYEENSLPQTARNQIFSKSSEHMEELPDSCIHLMITSPPYNASKEYDEDLKLEDYLNMLVKVWRETYRVLVPGGRACVNIANLGRKPYIPIHSFLIETMLETGFLMRGEIIWNKAASASASTAWGSWRSAANPVLRDVHEYVLVFSKATFRRPRNGKISTISRDEFLEWTKSVWTFPAVSAKKIGHPAPFPEELPHRLIQLYSFKSDVILDPFAGSGTTCLAALTDERDFVGYEIRDEYSELARKRIKAFSQKP
jgi:site-specific DNA-methyltransferase (adenine-specific)